MGSDLARAFEGKSGTPCAYCGSLREDGWAAVANAKTGEIYCGDGCSLRALAKAQAARIAELEAALAACVPILRKLKAQHESILRATREKRAQSDLGRRVIEVRERAIASIDAALAGAEAREGDGDGV